MPARADDLGRHVGALLGASLVSVDLDTWAERVSGAGMYGNLAALVGHGSLRAGVMGVEARAPDAAERDELQRLTSV